MFLYRFDRVCRASRREPAGGRSKWGYANPIKIDRKQEQEREHPPQKSFDGHPDARHPGAMGFHKDSFSEIRESAIFIFSSSSAVAVSSSDR